MKNDKKALQVFVPAILIIVLLVAIAVPSFAKARKQSQRNACVNNLRILDAAISQGAMADGYSDGQNYPVEKFTQYMKGRTLPKCPSGGHYNIPPVGKRPTCSFHGGIAEEAQPEN